MSTQEIAHLVAYAIALDKQLNEVEAKLKAAKADLIALATEKGEQTSTDGGGWSVVFEADNGDVARVTQPGRKLKSSFKVGTKEGEKIQAILGTNFYRCFESRTIYVPLPNIRDVVAEYIKSPAQQKRVIKAVTSDSAPQVAFEVKSAAHGERATV
jgi:hypothetical protein